MALHYLQFTFSVCALLTLGLTSNQTAWAQRHADGESIINTLAVEDNNLLTVWSRIRDGFQIPNMKNSLVDEKMRGYLSDKKYFLRMTDRSSLYLYHIVEEVKERNLPMELALLPFIESAFVADATSRVKAAGLWQFMPRTGKFFDLDQTMWKDDRCDVLQSTAAALDYLQSLHKRFGDWQLALAAYNWGEGSVARAIAKNKQAGKPTDYMSLDMPNETRNYFPKLQAVKNIVANPSRYKINLSNISNEPYFVQIYKDTDIDVNTAAELAEMRPQDFRSLNPSFNRPVIVASHNHSMLLPAEKIDTFIENLASWRATRKPLSNWTVYKVQPGDTISSIARRARMTESDFRDTNQIPPNQVIRPGSVVLVNRFGTLQNDIPATTVNSTIALTDEVKYRRVVYRVRKGDTLAKIASRMNVNTTSIMKDNRLKSQRLSSGQRLVINAPVKNRQIAPIAKRNNTPRFYVVRKGDTLYSLSGRLKISPNAIKRANGMTSNTLRIGQRLVINEDGLPLQQKVAVQVLQKKEIQSIKKRSLENYSTHIVKRGDTLFSIASAKKTSVNALKQLNNLTNSTLRIGQKLIITSK